MKFIGEQRTDYLLRPRRYRVSHEAAHIPSILQSQCRFTGKKLYLQHRDNVTSGDPNKGQTTPVLPDPPTSSVAQ